MTTLYTKYSLPAEFYDKNKFKLIFFKFVIAKERPMVKHYADGHKEGVLHLLYIFSDIESSKISQRTSLRLTFSDS